MNRSQFKLKFRILPNNSIESQMRARYVNIRRVIELAIHPMLIILKNSRTFLSLALDLRSIYILDVSYILRYLRYILTIFPTCIKAYRMHSFIHPLEKYRRNTFLVELYLGPLSCTLNLFRD